MRTKEQTEKAIAELRKQIPAFAKKIRKFYIATEWKWFIPEKGGEDIPTVKDIEKIINMHLDHFLKDMNVKKVSSGGISIIENDYMDEKYLTIEFHYGINGYLE